MCERESTCVSIAVYLRITEYFTVGKANYVISQPKAQF